MMSDDSENDEIDNKNDIKNNLYLNKFKLLLDECANTQKSNEILVFRIQEVNKIIKRREKEVVFFKKRLFNNYGEDWTIIPKKYYFDDDNLNVKLKGNNIKNEKNESDEKIKLVKKPNRRRTNRSERDPNAPKRPSNPFFQFCQEQRQILMEQLNSELKPGECEPTKQELTRQLAIKWRNLSGIDKKVYVDMYEKSKQKYEVEMTQYNLKK